jgi:hypothetical protein
MPGWNGEQQMGTTNAPTRLDADTIASSISLKSLIAGFQNYRCTALNVLHYRRRYADIYITPYPDSKLGDSIYLALYGIALAFCLYAPVIHKHGLHLAKLYFLIQFVYSILLALLLLHFSVKIFRGRGTIRQTTAAYCTWLGFISPIVLLIDYPLFYYIAPENFILIHNVTIADVPRWALIWNIICFALVIIASIYLMLNWMASVHSMRRWKLTVSWFVIFLPVKAIHDIFVAPIVNEVLKTIAEIGDSII